MTVMCAGSVIGLSGGLEDIQILRARRASRPLSVPGLFLGTVAASTSKSLRRLCFALIDALRLGAGFEDGSRSVANDGWAGADTPALYEPVAIGGRAWR